MDHLNTAMTFQGVFLLAWAAILVSDALIVKKLLKIGPRYYEARQEYLYKWNPVGVVASGLGTFAALGYMGTFLQSTAAFFAAILAAVLTVMIAINTKGKYYLSSEPRDVHEEYFAA